MEGLAGWLATFCRRGGSVAAWSRSSTRPSRPWVSRSPAAAAPPASTSLSLSSSERHVTAAPPRCSSAAAPRTSGRRPATSRRPWPWARPASTLTLTRTTRRPTPTTRHAPSLTRRWRRPRWRASPAEWLTAACNGRRVHRGDWTASPACVRAVHRCEPLQRGLLELNQDRDGAVWTEADWPRWAYIWVGASWRVRLNDCWSASERSKRRRCCSNLVLLVSSVYNAFCHSIQFEPPQPAVLGWVCLYILQVREISEVTVFVAKWGEGRVWTPLTVSRTMQCHCLPCQLVVRLRGCYEETVPVEFRLNGYAYKVSGVREV